jgi:hypothetical protein
MQSFGMLKNVVNIETAGLERVTWYIVVFDGNKAHYIGKNQLAFKINNNNNNLSRQIPS